MPSTSVIASCTVVATISYLAMAYPIPQTTNNMAPKTSMNGQVTGGPGMANGNPDLAAMGGYVMNPMGNGMVTPAKNSVPPPGVNGSMGPGGNGSMGTYAPALNPTSTLPKNQSGMMNMDSDTMYGGARPMNNMPPNARPMAGAMDQKNRTNTMSGPNDMGANGMAANSYGSPAVNVNNTAVPNPPSNTSSTGTSISTRYGHLIEASGVAIALVFFA